MWIYVIPVIVCLLMYISKKCYDLLVEYIHVNKNKSYIELGDYFLSLAYDVIYKSHILAFSGEGFKLSQDKLESTQRDFIKLTISLMGPKIYKFILSFYGDKNSFYVNCVIWFQVKLDSDEILKFSTQLKEESAETTINKAFDNNKIVR